MAEIIQPQSYWDSINPILNSGDIGVVRETGEQKRGDGSNRWSQLSYLVDMPRSIYDPDNICKDVFDMDNMKGGSSSTIVTPTEKATWNAMLTTVDVYNVTVKIPLTAGSYYILATATAAVPESIRKRGLILMFETSSGVWQTYQFIGASVSTWEAMTDWDNWNEYTGNGSYMGLATTSTNPTVVSGVTQWWLASGAGTYTNFGNLTITGNFAILSYSGSTWSKYEQTITAPNVVQTTGTSETDVMSQKAVTDELALKADQTELVQLAGDVALKVDNIEQKVGVTYTEFPSLGWIDYNTGEKKAGASGFRFIELNVNEGEKYSIFTSVSYNPAAVIAMYSGDTYVKASSIAYSTVNTTITIPSGITGMIVAAQFSTWMEDYYVTLESSFASKSIEANVASIEDEVSSINTRIFSSPFSVSKGYVLYATGELAPGTDGFKYEEINVKEGDFVHVFTKITPTTAAVIAAYSGDTYVQSASIKTNSQINNIDYVVPAGVNKLRVSAQYDLGTEQYYVKTYRYALYSETVFTKQDDGYFGNFPKYQDFVVGRQSILYLNNIGRKYEDTLNEFYTSQSGYVPSGYRGSPLAISYTPTATGSTDITFVKKRNISDTLASKKITFRAVSKNTGSGETKNIIFIGDSLIASGDASKQVYNMLVEDADYTVNMLGDHETGSKVNAGHGSWSWVDWINPAGESTAIYGMLNPFMHNGELDFTNFMSVNYPTLSGIDIAVISLGTNDMGQGAGGISSAQNAVANAKVFIDALLADYPNVKIAIGIPSCGAYSAGSTGFSHYPQGFRNSILFYAKEMIDTFDNGAYHANVTCVYHGWFIDPDNDYPNNEITLPSGVKTKCVTNFIHPSTIGYQHWGVGYYNKIRAILSGLL